MKKFLVKSLVLLPLLFGTAKMGAQISIGADKAPKPFSVLELVSQYKTGTYGGLRLPQMETAQRDALGDLSGIDAYGLMIFNTSVNCLEYWNSIKWVSLCLGTADITLTPENGCNPEDPFAADGSEACTFTPEDHPPCVMSSGQAYLVYLTAGAAYTTLQVDELTSAFTITFAPNNSSYNRIAVVRVVNNCSGEYKDFVFTQEGAECPEDVKGFTVGTTSSTLCGNNGAVIAWVNSPEAGVDYVWAYGGQIAHTGNYLEITRAGTYIVYAGLLGCDDPVPDTIIIIQDDGYSSGAPTLAVTNGGILCAGGSVVLTASNVTSGNKVKWFHDGALHSTTTENTLTADDASFAGEWFVTQQDDPCGSKMSNIIYLYDRTGSSVALAQPIATVNGDTLGGSVIPVICKGGTLELAVINDSPPYSVGTVYEWFDGTTSIYKGTDPIIYPVAQDKANMVLSVQVSNNSGGCPNMVVSNPIPVTLSAPAATTINNGAATAAICGSMPAFLLALDASGVEYEWFNNGVKVTTTYVANYSASIVGSYTVRYKNSSGCWSLLSLPINVVQSAFISLNWYTAPPDSILLGSSGSYTVLASPPDNATFHWKSDDNNLATVTQIPPGNSATVNYLVIDDPGPTITVTASNACGTDSLYQTVKIKDACPPINVVTITPNTTVNLYIDNAGNPMPGSQSSVTFMANAANADSYEWYVGSTLQPETSNQFVFSPVLSISGTYTVYVKAKNNCDNEATSAPVTVNVVKLTTPDVSGNYRLGGKTCFDVAYINESDECLPLIRRTNDFPAINMLFAYTFNGTPGYTDLAFFVMDPNGLIKDTSQVGNVFQITFVDDIRDKAQDRDKTEALKVTIVATFKEGVTDKYVQRVVSVQDCHCGCIAKKSDVEYMYFMCYNMGAHNDVKSLTPTQQQALSGTNREKNYGDIYQWGRSGKDDHQLRTSPCWPASPACGSTACGSVSSWDSDGQVNCCAAPYGSFIRGYCNNNDWRTTPNPKLWDKNENGTASTNPLKYEGNDPCPDGWRVPTYNELYALTDQTLNTRSAFQTTNTAGFLFRPNDPGSTEWTLFLPAAGYRHYSDGSFHYVGSYGRYWSSSTNGTNSYYLLFNSGNFSMNNSGRAYGDSVRCVADEN